MIRKFNKYNIYSDTKEALNIIELWSNFHENYDKKEKLNKSLDGLEFLKRLEKT